MYIYIYMHISMYKLIIIVPLLIMIMILLLIMIILMTHVLEANFMLWDRCTRSTCTVFVLQQSKTTALGGRARKMQRSKGQCRLPSSLIL